VNPVLSNKTGCSIVYDILSAPYVAQFGALQILSSGAMGVAIDKNGTQSSQVLFEESRCLVPESYGVSYQEIKETKLWDMYCMGMPRQRLASEKKYKSLWRAPLV
jgi:hypothetical protein